MQSLSDNLENWMGRLPPDIRDVSIIYLAIPGTHNSMTYGINSSSALAPDAEDFVRKAYRVAPCIVRRWSKTQEISTIDQLNLGIRYFDLRVSTKRVVNGNTEVYYCHALYCFEITKSLQQINDFLTNHPKEFVILDFQHFYDFTDRDHVNLQRQVMDIFAGKLFKPSDGTLENCSLNRAEELGKQVLVIYRGYIVPFYFWSSYYWPTPWPNQDNTSKLMNYLNEKLQQRTPGFGYVTQMIITPSTKFIALRTFSSLKPVAKKVLNDFSDWLKDQRPGPFALHDKRTSNVFIADFINIRDTEFCKTVIDLNRYLTKSGE